MKGKISLLTVLVLAICMCQPGLSRADEVMDELNMLKSRIKQLEQKLQNQEQAIEGHSADLKKLESLKRVVSDLEISVDATSVVQGIHNNDDNYDEVRGVPRRGDDWDAQYTVDVEISSKIGENGKALLLLEAGEGEGVNDEQTAFGYPNDEAIGDDADVKVSEIWYEHKLFDNMVAITAGKLDLRRWFDTNAVANDEESQFLNRAFVNNLAIDLPGDYDEDDFTYGLRIAVRPTDTFDINFGYVEEDGDFEDIFDENLYILEAGFHPSFGELKGNYRIYGWLNTFEHYEIDDPKDDDDDVYGIGLSIDQELTKDIALFGRFGWQDDDIYPVEYAWSGGLQFDGRLWGRENDMLGMAYARSDTSEDYRDTQRYNERTTWWGKTVRRRSGFDTNPAEHVAELYYRVQVNDHLSITPDAQLIENMAGYDSDTVYIVGVRAHVAF